MKLFLVILISLMLLFYMSPLVLWVLGLFGLHGLSVYSEPNNPDQFFALGLSSVVWGMVSVMIMRQLFKPAWKSKNEKEALRSVEKMTDQTLLADIAKNASDSDVREAAFNRITEVQY
ncbi:MAG: hypothetical protein LBS59_09700 [Puniceicoccales bacterium]|jgi:hypothetical protein|nr:hypothetical protein [Puniceicoccales bacterium]